MDIIFLEFINLNLSHIIYEHNQTIKPQIPLRLIFVLITIGVKKTIEMPHHVVAYY